MLFFSAVRSLASDCLKEYTSIAPMRPARRRQPSSDRGGPGCIAAFRMPGHRLGAASDTTLSSRWTADAGPHGGWLVFATELGAAVRLIRYLDRLHSAICCSYGNLVRQLLGVIFKLFLTLLISGLLQEMRIDLYFFFRRLFL